MDSVALIAGRYVFNHRNEVHVYNVLVNRRLMSAGAKAPALLVCGHGGGIHLEPHGRKTGGVDRFRNANSNNV